MSRIQVLIDGVAFENANQIGIWRVFFEVISRLKSEVDFVVLLDRDAVNKVPSGVPIFRSSHRRQGYHRTPAINKLKRKIAERKLERLFPRAIWHSTFFTPDPRSRGRSVVHVYDMIAERFYYLSPFLEEQSSLKAAIVPRADRVISISKATTQELVRFYPSLGGKIATATLGSEHFTRVGKTKTTRLSNCLFVGHRNSYKNFQLIVRALALRRWPKEVKLHVVGAPFTQAEIAFIQYYGVESKIKHLGKLSDAELSQQYLRSQSFIFPSLDEGFGLPVLESQAHGCLPILSDIPIFREVAGGAAAFFDPHDPGSLAEQIAAATLPVCTSIRLRCKENAERFSWDETAELIYNCYFDLA